MNVAAPAVAGSEHPELEQWILDAGAQYDVGPTGTAGVRMPRTDLGVIVTTNGIAVPDHIVIVNVDTLHKKWIAFRLMVCHLDCCQSVVVA